MTNIIKDDNRLIVVDSFGTMTKDDWDKKFSELDKLRLLAIQQKLVIILNAQKGK